MRETWENRKVPYYESVKEETPERVVPRYGVRPTLNEKLLLALADKQKYYRARHLLISAILKHREDLRGSLPTEPDVV